MNLLKKKWIDGWRGLLLFGLFIFGPAVLPLFVVGELCGTPSDLHALTAYYGPSETFTCEWKSPNGQEALFQSSGGSRRFIDLGKSHADIKVGEHYDVQSHWSHKWASQLYLIRVGEADNG